MIKSDKKLNDLSKLLKTKNYTLINEAINLLREEKPFEGAISLITAYYDKTDDFTTRKTIEAFMNDLKDPSVRVEIIKEIRKQWDDNTISMLVASCWQSGLNYSEYSIDLAKVFLKGDYVTAIECLTVIEESVNDLNINTRRDIIKLVEESPLSHTNEKKPLIIELMSILER